MFYNKCFYYLLYFYIWEKSCSWDIGQNALSQPDCRIFKSSISPEQIDETASFLACWYKFAKIKSWLKIFWLGIVKNGFDPSGLWTLKLTVSEEWTDGINCFFACWYRFTKIKSWSKIYWVSMVKNGCGQFGYRTLKLTLSQKWTDGINFFFLHAGFLGGHVQKWQWSFNSWDPDICSILRISLWIELIFWVLIVML